MRNKFTRRCILIFTIILMVFDPWGLADEFKLPLKFNSVRFAIIGDMGTGTPAQYDLAKRLAASREYFPYDFALTLGDNLYGGSGTSDFEQKFELPYKALLDTGMKFYATLGNHDNPNERAYKYFGMNGANYYTFTRGNVSFFVLDSNYMSPQQLSWLTTELENASSKNWKI